MFASFSTISFSTLKSDIRLVLNGSWDWEPFGHNSHGPKRGGLLCTFLGGNGSPYNTMWPWPRSTSVVRTKWHLDPSSRLTIIHGPKFGELLCHSLLGEGELGPHLTQCGLDWGLPPCQVSSWSSQPFGYNTPTSPTAQTGQRSDSIRRTVLQTVAQKSWQ